MVPMSTKITRRELAAAVSASAALLAQPAPPPLPQNPEEELQAARDQVHQTSETLTKFAIPMPTEPAVHFKA